MITRSLGGNVRKTFTRLVAGAALAVTLAATPATASAAPISASHGSAVPTQTLVHLNGGAWGPEPPNLDVYPNHSQTFLGPDALDNCIAFGTGGGVWWAAWYCWVHNGPSGGVVDLYYRVS
jgi:hypothetical protein